MDGKRIQFGHTHGVLILTLGFILLAAQGLISFHWLPLYAQVAPVDGTSSANHVMFLIPGIAGVLTIGVGLYFLAQDKFKNRNTQPPPKTKSGLPM